MIVDKTHLLIISPSLKAGGIERALTVLANEFVRRGIKVSFFVCLPGEAHYQLDPAVTLYRAGIPYANKSDKVFFYLRLLRRLRQQTKSLQPQVVLSFGDVFNPLVLLSLIGLKYPVFISDRTSPDFRINPLASLLKQRLYPRAAGMISQTARAAKIQRARYGRIRNIKIIPNAIKLVDCRGDFDRAQRILYVGRLSREKGVDRLIHAFGLLPKAKKWQLDIVGEGPEEQRLSALAQDWDIGDSVVFHGLVKAPSAWYMRTSIFVLPSHIEGFPNALCEAMSAGLPVVCFDSIPYESIFTNNESGIAVEKDNIEALSAALNYLMERPEVRIQMGKKARQESQRFRQDKIASQYLAFMGLPKSGAK